MQRRTTSIIGAGAVLDFDFHDNERPTTDYITEICREQKIQGFNGDDIDLIEQIYDRALGAAEDEYKRLHPNDRNHSPRLSFEELLEVIETLYSYNGTWEHERATIPLISGLVKSDIRYKTVEYHRALETIIRTIINIVHTYDRNFREENCEVWYKQFWKNFNGLIDFFNFNYDTTIEFSLEQYNDGFVDYTPELQRFDPMTLWNNEGKSPTVSHLHGCILYADENSKELEFKYSHRDLYKRYTIDEHHLLSYQCLPQNQVGDSIFYAPIITGLKKTDKLCYMPHSIYHAHLVKKILENPSLLICGYSFGDLYVNQILERHKLIHGKNQRVVIIDKWPDYVNNDYCSLYRHYMDDTSDGLKEFVGRITEGGIAPLETFKQFEQIAEDCWQSPNGVLRLYTKGLKYAVVNHQNVIIQFLQGEDAAS